MRASLLLVCAALASAGPLLVSTVTGQCPQADWLHRGASCYKWFASPQYWFQAEQMCLSHQAHLVSIGSKRENTLVGRLSNCTHAWIGRFGTDLKRLSDPTSYSWTDGSDALSFERHNFSQLDSVHKPLIRSDGVWWLNSLYHERHPFVCEAGADSSAPNNSSEQLQQCPNGWSLFRNHCYIMPHFEANFNEANFYCQRNSSQVASVNSEAELSFINKLTFGIDSCESNNALDSVWLGLIKLNPCFPDSAGRELCYQWTDFSGKHAGFPRWHSQHPNSQDWTVNCATLAGDRLLRSDRCYTRHRFVCKSPAGGETDGGGGVGPVDGVVAAFDFRKGLHNLVDAKTYVVTDEFGVPRTVENGICFSGIAYYNGTYYSIGETVPYEDSLLGLSEWTMFFVDRVEQTGKGIFFFSLNGLVGSRYQCAFFGCQYLRGINATGGNWFMSTGQQTPSGSASLYNYLYTFAPDCRKNSWCEKSIAMSNFTSNVSVNGFTPYRSEHRVYNDNRRPEDLQLHLVFAPSRRHYYSGEYCVKCFGIAEKKLSADELRKVIDFYCP